MKTFNIEIELSDQEIEFLKGVELVAPGNVLKGFNSKNPSVESLLDKELLINTGKVIFATKIAISIINEIKIPVEKFIYNDTTMDYLTKLKQQVEDALKIKK